MFDIANDSIIRSMLTGYNDTASKLKQVYLDIKRTQGTPEYNDVLRRKKTLTVMLNEHTTRIRNFSTRDTIIVSTRSDDYKIDYLSNLDKYVSAYLDSHINSIISNAPNLMNAVPFVITKDIRTKIAPIYVQYIIDHGDDESDLSDLMSETGDTDEKTVHSKLSSVRSKLEKYVSTYNSMYDYLKKSPDIISLLESNVLGLDSKSLTITIDTLLGRRICDMCDSLGYSNATSYDTACTKINKYLRAYGIIGESDHIAHIRSDIAFELGIAEILFNNVSIVDIMNNPIVCDDEYDFQSKFKSYLKNLGIYEKPTDVDNFINVILSIQRAYDRGVKNISVAYISKISEVMTREVYRVLLEIIPALITANKT